MRYYYILGSGGLAKEILFLLSEIEGGIQNFGGFIEKNPKSANIFCMNKKLNVINEDDFLKNKNFDCNLYIGIGNPSVIHKVSEKFKEYTFPNLIHPKVNGHFSSISLERGNILTAGCIFTVDIKIGSFNIFNLNTTVGHDSIIGSYNVLNPGVNVSGSVKIGDKNLLGTNCAILQGVNIGSNTIVGGGALVNRDVESDFVVAGVPAKKIKNNG